MKAHKLTGGREIELVNKIVSTQEAMFNQLRSLEQDALRVQAQGAQEFAKIIKELKQQMKLAAESTITSIDFKDLKTKNEVTVHVSESHGPGCTCSIDSPEVEAMLEKIVTGAKVN